MALVVGAGAILLVGIVFRFLARSDLWLDEALTVTISRLPLADIPGALRNDGAPPLYYVLLHGWTSLLGTGDLAARSLSGVCSVVTLPVVWATGRRLGGARVAWSATLLFAANPFAIRYATEARMYSLVVLESALGVLVVLWALDSPTPRRLAAASLLAAALLYTHYWALYLIAGGGLVLLVRAWHGDRLRSPEARLLAALAVGGVLWLPWVPTFLFQAKHTGTPWATPAGPSALINLVTEYAGGGSEGPRILGIALTLLIALGTLGRPIDDRHVELDLRGQRGARPLLGLLIGAPAIALLAGLASKSAFIPRYTSIVLPMFLMLAGLGMGVILDRRIAACLIAALSLLGFSIATQAMLRNRTQAGQLAGYLAAAARPGDVVAFCPDQLGPSTARLLGSRFTYIGFPRGTDPRLVNWVDYADVNKAASPAAFAKQLDERTGVSHDVWLISSPTYRTSSKSCIELENRLLALRPRGRQVVAARPGKFFESANLALYPSGAA
jgi:mannosyltransferase